MCLVFCEKALRSVSQSGLEHAGCWPSFLTALTLLSPPSATNHTFLLNLNSTGNKWKLELQYNQYAAVLGVDPVSGAFSVTSTLLSSVRLSCGWMCLFWPAALVCSSLSVLRWLFASYWFPLCKATVSGTALICRCTRRTAGRTVGPRQAAAAALRRATERTWRERLHRRQTASTTSTDTGQLP